MSGGPTQDVSLHRRLAATEHEIRQLRRLVDRLAAPLFQHLWPEDVRLGRTVLSAAGTYPTYPANTFWIEFTDSHFPPTAGLQVPTHDLRGEKIIAHAFWDGWIPLGTPVVVMRDRGLGAAADGEWWILQPNDLVELCLSEDHPGRGIKFAAKLGAWDPSVDGWRYESAGATCNGVGTVAAIDWRYGVPYPLAGAKGLFWRRPSDTYTWIYECVSLDCESPGADCCTYVTGP